MSAYVIADVGCAPMRLAILLVVLLTVAPEARGEDAAPTRLTLDQLIARSLSSSRASMAHEDTAAARARLDEAKAARLPKLSALAFLAPSPEILCVDPDCTTTDPENVELRLHAGVFVGSQITITQPVFTFGKLTAIRAAARAGVQAQAALEDALAGDLAVEAATAYYGLKLARELVIMLEDGIAEIGAARERLEERLAAGTGEATVQDRQRIDTLLAEAKIQLTEARAAEATALAGVQAIADEKIDIDEEPLEAIEAALAPEDDVVAKAKQARPEVRAADAGARAADELEDFERNHYWPDLALVGNFTVTRAQGVDDAPSAVYTEPYNNTFGGLSVVLRWNAEPWTTKARVTRARAAARKAEDLRDLAETGATLDAKTAWGQAAQAKERVTAAEEGETAARGWLASVLQADAIGTAETRDLSDAYIAWFQMRARLATAIFQWNVATVRLGRATGEFKATAGRRKEHE
jgi:outer membrane protein TolC